MDTFSVPLNLSRQLPNFLPQQIQTIASADGDPSQNRQSIPQQFSQVARFPQMQQSVPLQMPIPMGYGHAIYHPMHASLQAFAGQIPGFVQSQMQVCSPYTQVAIAYIITPTGQIQQVHLAPMNQLQNLRVAQAAALQQPNVMPHMHAGIQPFPVQNIHDLGNVQMTPASAFNGATNALAPLPNAHTLQLRLPQAPLEAVQRQNQAQQNQSWNNTSSTHVKKQPQKPQLSLESDSTDASTEVKTQNKRVPRVTCACPDCVEHELLQHTSPLVGPNKVVSGTSPKAIWRWHTGKYPHVCPWELCGKNFTTFHALQRHQLLHTGEKRFECPECSKKFSRNDNLTQHFQRHSKQKKLPKSSRAAAGKKSQPAPISASQVVDTEGAMIAATKGSTSTKMMATTPTSIRKA